MAKFDLRRALKGPNKKAVSDYIELLGSDHAVVDLGGRTLLGAEPSSDGHAIDWAGSAVGYAHGQAAAKLAEFVAYVYGREAEKRALADETLGRYKELTLIYDTSEMLSRVLDVREVATAIADHARRFLSARTATLMLFDARKAALEPISVSAEPGATVELISLDDAGIEARVTSSGQSEFIEYPEADAGGAIAVMCAPLRAGENVIGILRVTHDARGAWTAGDLKLVTSLAANAASAISHANLHQEQLRQQALRGQVERYVSTYLGPLVAERAGADDLVAILFTDLETVTSGSVDELPPREVVELVSEARVVALRVLMEAGAIVNVTSADTVVAAFCGAGSSNSMRAALRAARKVANAFRERSSLSEHRPTITVTESAPEPETLLTNIGAAAAWQGQAGGRIFVGSRVVELLGADSEFDLEQLDDERWEYRT